MRATERVTDWSEVPILLGVLDLQTFFGFTRTSSYELARTLGRRIGRRLVIPKETLRAWIEDGAKVA